MAIILTLIDLYETFFRKLKGDILLITSVTVTMTPLRLNAIFLLPHRIVGTSYKNVKIPGYFLFNISFK